MVILITPELGSALHEYLMGRPMREVENLVRGLREAKAQPAEPAAPPVEETA